MHEPPANSCHSIRVDKASVRQKRVRFQANGLRKEVWSGQQTERVLVPEKNPEGCEAETEGEPVTYILVQEVIQSLSQTLPGELEERDLQELMKA